MNKKLIGIGGIVLGVLCLMLAFVYWTTPASLLPSFLPGHDPGSIGIHVKHGVAAFILGLAFFVLVWFASGKKSGPEELSREDKRS